MDQKEERIKKIELNETLAKEHGVDQTYMLIKINHRTKESSLVRSHMSKKEADTFVEVNKLSLKDFSVIGFPNTKHSNGTNDFVVFK